MAGHEPRSAVMQQDHQGVGMQLMCEQNGHERKSCWMSLEASAAPAPPTRAPMPIRTPRGDDPVKWYLRNIGTQRLLTPEEVTALARRIQQIIFQGNRRRTRRISRLNAHRIQLMPFFLLGYNR